MAKLDEGWWEALAYATSEHVRTLWCGLWLDHNPPVQYTRHGKVGMYCPRCGKRW